MCNLCNLCNLSTGPDSGRSIFVRPPCVVGFKHDPPARHTGCEDAPVAQVAHRGHRFGQFLLLWLPEIAQGDPDDSWLLRQKMTYESAPGPVTERVLDALDPLTQSRGPAPKRSSGRPLSYTPEVADELCERLEAGEQIGREARMPAWKTLRRHSGRLDGRHRRTPGGSDFPPARARPVTSRRTSIPIERSTFARGRYRAFQARDRAFNRSR
jgi:hypothetical protein